MLRAGSLFYALSISVILALVSISLLLGAHYTRMDLLRDQMREDVFRDSKSGLELLMGDQTAIGYGSPKDIDLFGNGSDSVLLEKKTWGAFEIAISHAHNKFFNRQLIASVGWQNQPNDRTALVLADLDKPLSITGKTRLAGDCYLPQAGIQRAYIEGQSYSGNKLVDGEIKTSNRFLPEYNDTLVKRIEKSFEFQPTENDSVIDLQQFQQSDSITNSFSNRPLYVFSEDTILIRSEKINGQVCIISRKGIRIGKNSSIQNALLLAPKIFIEDGVEGNFQAFARDSLVAGEKIHLHYPSVLGIIANSKSPDVSSLFIGEKSRIFGQLFACSTANDFRKHVIISTAIESIIYGEIYSADLVEHRGTVFGDLVCAKFELKTASAEYENHLMDAVIDRPKRSEDFVASAIARKKTDHETVIEFLK